MKRVFFPLDIQHIRIRHVKKFLGNRSHQSAGRIIDLIIPFQKVSFHLPSIKINVVMRHKKCKFLADAPQILLVLIQFKFWKEGKDLLLQLFNQMRFQIPYMIFYCWFALGFSGRRRKNNRTVKILQIRER